MPVSVEVFGGAASVLFRGAPSSVWGTEADNPVVAMVGFFSKIRSSQGCCIDSMY
jgi:hypothetical protein